MFLQICLSGNDICLCSKHNAVDSHSPYGQRTTVVCRKDHSTPQKYPREAGTPSKLPL